MMDGFKDRVQKEMDAICNGAVDPLVIAPADRKFSAWLGGSLLSSLSSFNHLWIT